MAIIGIETSCDETSCGIVDGNGKLLANIVHSQAIHRNWGGVVPELASREHIKRIDTIVRQALSEAALTDDAIEAVAVTNGPGLAGGLLIGVNYAKGLAMALNKPLIGVNHLEGHVAAAWIKDGRGSPPPAPKEGKNLVCLIVSGGHTDLVLMNPQFEFKLIGATLDDAAGEVFDKVARFFGLPYPGGPPMQELAAQAPNISIDPLPRAWLRGTYDFSFSGLKTESIRRARETDMSQKSLALLAREFQFAVADVLVSKTLAAARDYDCDGVVLVGGVAANRFLRRRFGERGEQAGIAVTIPAIGLCTDNGAMIAMRGLQLLNDGGRDGWDLDVVPNLQIGAPSAAAT